MGETLKSPVALEVKGGAYGFEYDFFLGVIHRYSWLSSLCRMNEIFPATSWRDGIFF
jgi:hypothetical protein